MLKHPGKFVHITTSSGFEADVYSDGINFKIKVGEELYDNRFSQGTQFFRVTRSDTFPEPLCSSHTHLGVEEVTDAALIKNLKEAKYAYIEENFV